MLTIDLCYQIVETTANKIRKPQDLHHKFIKRLSPAEKQKWIDKIWTSNSVESHAEEEPIEILAWYEEHGRVKREISLYREGLVYSQKFCFDSVFKPLISFEVFELMEIVFCKLD